MLAPRMSARAAKPSNGKEQRLHERDQDQRNHRDQEHDEISARDRPPFAIDRSCGPADLGHQRLDLFGAGKGGNDMIARAALVLGEVLELELEPAERAPNRASQDQRRLSAS